MTNTTTAKKVKKLAKAKVRAISPMNKGREPLDWPIASPKTLSEDAQLVYRLAESGRPLTHDLFDSATRSRRVSPSDADAYRPSERVLAAIAELVAVGLASYSPKSRFLYITKVSDEYTVAEGRGSQLIHAYLVSPETDSRTLLGVFIGGDLESRDNRTDELAELTVRVRHATATDQEHDAASTALLVISAPSFPYFPGYGKVSFKGFLTQVNLYPFGVDPLTQKGYDPEEVCDMCEDERPFAPFLPPAVELPLSRKGTVVEIECLPLRPYLVTA